MDDARQAELQRRSNDLIRVYNPLNVDYVVEYDKANGGQKFRVPAKTEKVLVRYIAEKYMREMTQKMRTVKVDMSIKEENDRRASSGFPKMNKWDEEMIFSQPLLDMSPEKNKELLKLLYRGVESEFGVDGDYNQEQEMDNSKPAFEQALEELEMENAGILPGSEKDEVFEVEKEEKEKPIFACDQCDFTTTAKIALAGHKRKHKSKLKEKALSEISES